MIKIKIKNDTGNKLGFYVQQKDGTDKCGILMNGESCEMPNGDELVINSETSHNNDFKAQAEPSPKPCPTCEGKGRNDITVGNFNYKDNRCPTCKGQGFVKP